MNKFESCDISLPLVFETAEGREGDDLMDTQARQTRGLQSSRIFCPAPPAS